MFRGDNKLIRHDRGKLPGLIGACEWAETSPALYGKNALVVFQTPCAHMVAFTRNVHLPVTCYALGKRH